MRKRFKMQQLALAVLLATMTLSGAGLAPTSVAGTSAGANEAMTNATSSPDVEVVRRRAWNELQALTGAHDRMWGFGEADWSADLNAGTIEFRNKKGWVITAPVQVVGTYNTLDGTFLWGWDHPSVRANVAVAARKVLEFGKKHGIVELTTRKVDVTEDEAWRFAALANHLAGGSGAYRGPSGTTLVFMTFGQIRIQKR
jgi:hypothetical protein